MTSMQPMRWAIVGYGWAARDMMAPAILANGDVIVAVADPSAAARAEAGRRGIASFASLDTLLETAKVDVVYVATPNAQHADAVARIAARGLAVLCEKPMAATLAEAESMAAAVATSGVLYGTAFDQRYHPAHLVMAERIATGAIGTPVAVRIVYACWLDPRWSPTGADDNWRTDHAVAGGGAVIDLALHGLDLVQRLLGEAVERLHIGLQRRIHAYPVDDGGMLIGRTRGGTLVSLHVAYNCPDSLPRRRLEVLGDAGLLVAHNTMGQTAGGRLSLRCARTGIESEVEFDGAGSPFAAQANAFASAARGQPHDFSLVRDLDLMRVFDSAHREALACL